MTVSQPPPRSNNAAGRRTVLGACFLLALVVFFIFGRTRGYGFVNFDDGDYFSSNYHVRAGLTWKGVLWAFQTGYASNWHPLTWLSLMLDAQLFGIGPAGPHLINVILHAANASAVVSPAKTIHRHIMAQCFCRGGVCDSSAACGVGGVGVRAQGRVERVVLHADTVDVCAVCTRCDEWRVAKDKHNSRHCRTRIVTRHPSPVTFLRFGPVVFRAGFDEQANAGDAAVSAAVAGLLAARKGDK